MWRLVLAVIVVGGLVFVGVRPAAAFDYQETTVPTEFLLAQQAPAPVIGQAERTTFFRLALTELDTVDVAVANQTGSGVTWVRYGAPSDGAYIPGSHNTVWEWGN